MALDKKLVEHKEVRSSILVNPSMIWIISPTPDKEIWFKSEIIDSNRMRCEIIIEYGIVGHVKPLGMPQAENPKGHIFTDLITSSEFELLSDSDHFKNGRFEYNTEYEYAITDISLIAIDHHATLLKEKLKETEMTDYEVIKFTESSVRVMLRQSVFGKN